jgi:hypothetical protein
LADLAAGHFFMAADISQADFTAAVDMSAADFTAAADVSAADFAALAAAVPVAATEAIGNDSVLLTNQAAAPHGRHPIVLGDHLIECILGRPNTGTRALPLCLKLRPHSTLTPWPATI